MSAISFIRVVCLFVWLVFFFPLEKVSLKWRRHHNGEELEILTYARHLRPLSSESSLACHNCYDIVTLTPTDERLTVELSLPVFTRGCRGSDSNTQPSACGANAQTDCANAAAIHVVDLR